MYQLGSDVGQGRENEAALPHARMRDHEIGFVEPGIADEQDVDIEGPGPPPLMADPTGVGLEPLSELEQLPRREIGLECDDSVEELPLLRPTDRFGHVHARQRDNLDSGRGHQAVDCSLQRAGPITEIRSEPEVRAGSDGLSAHELPADPDRDMVDHRPDGRVELADGHRHPVYPGIDTADLADPRREPLDQLMPLR